MHPLVALLKRAVATVGTRYIMAVCNFVLLLINARVLGASGLGEAGLLVAGVQIIHSFTNLIGGSSLIYFFHRHGVRRVLVIALGWGVLISFVGPTVMSLLGLADLRQWAYSVGLSLVFVSFNSLGRTLLSYEQVGQYNFTLIMQALIAAGTTIGGYYLLEITTPDMYIWGMLFGNGLCSLYCAALLLRRVMSEEIATTTYRTLIIQMARFGGWNMVDNVAGQVTLRINYFLLESFVGLRVVGLYEGALKLAECVLMVPRSLAPIFYASLTKMAWSLERFHVTRNYLVIVIVSVAAVLAGLLLLPEWVYTEYVFSSDFVGIKALLQLMSLGIIANGVNIIIIHYFTAVGKIKQAAISTLLGSIAISISGPLLISYFSWGQYGAASSLTIAYCITALYNLIIYFTKEPYTPSPR